MNPISRRQLLQFGSTLPVAIGAGRLLADQTPDSGILSQLPYSQVELLDGPLKQQFDQNHAFFLRLSEDRMLKIYRQRAGLPAPGPDMGGWYDDFCPGAHFGQYVSALARFAAITKSTETQAKVQRLVRGYAATVDPTGKFFVDLRYPGYTYDKLVIGLLDAHTLAEDKTALAVLARTTQAAVPHMPEKALTDEEKKQRPHKDETYLWDETYTMAENLFLAAEVSGNRRYFDMAKNYLLDKTFFDPLSEGQDVLPGLHAYSHANALSSGMQGYLNLGDAKYLRAVTNAVDMIWKDQSYATGGWGPNEGFVKPGSGELGASLESTHRSFETPCGSYAHFKVMRYLLRVTRDSRYGDSLERVMYNTVAGAKPIQEDGSSFYYSDYHHSGQKTYRRVIPGATYRWDLDGRWPCCSGTLPQACADYGISSYFLGNRSLYVNLYVPSRASWTEGGTRCSIIQDSTYPVGDLISMKVNTSAAIPFTVFLRIPAWAGKNTSVAVNGKRLPQELVNGTFFPIQRTWNNGDRIELHMDQPIRFEAVDAQTPDQIAVLRGPLVLFAMTGAPPVLRREELSVLSIKPDSHGWSVQTAQGEVATRPFFGIGDQIYQTYWNVARSSNS